MTALDLLRLAFLISLILSCGYAWRMGGEPERAGAIIILVGAVLSYPAAILFGHRWHTPEYGILIVDLAALVALLAIALRSDRYWPLFGAAFQLIAVITHLAMIVSPTLLPRAYSLAQPFWAYPLLVSLILGSWKRSRRISACAATR